MRHKLFLGLLVTITNTSVAFAQHEPQVQTLDAQLERMQSGQTMTRRDAAPQAMPVAVPATERYHRLAPSGHINSLGGGAIPALPLEIQTAGDIRFITGGVGDEEKAQLKMVEQDYNFRLLMTGIGGAFVSDATVRLIGSDDRLILSTDGAGPYLYAAVPPGSYKLEVTAPEGGIKTADVKVPATGFVKPVMRFTE
ncbi:MAG: hypothetical protein AB7L92_02765 [Alphaproteobacteria bacterium]